MLSKENHSELRALLVLGSMKAELKVNVSERRCGLGFGGVGSDLTDDLKNRLLV
jgi:hypothetical protein